MARRRLLTLVLFGLLAAALAGPADAARPGGYSELLRTARFEIHYVGGATPEGITHQQAGDLAVLFENAYATMVTGWGFPAPRNDGDGRIDVWVQDLSLLGALGFAEQDAPGNTSTGWISMDVTAIGSQAVVAHELMHLIQYATWKPADSWLLEGTAEWAGFTASGFKPFGGSILATVGAPDMSLDCFSLACGPAGDAYEVGGYSRWTFFQYLTERFGTGIVRDAFLQGALSGSPTQTGIDLLSAALVAKGTTLGNAYIDSSLAQIAGNYQVTGIKGQAPVTYATVPTGTQSLALPALNVAVNHLATRYVKFVRGGGNSVLCYPATLNLTVAMPAVGSRPSFYWKALGTAPVQLSVNGNTASLAVPWDTCTGSQDGYLALPNPSLTADGQAFVVSGSLAVDTSTVATAIGPPLTTYAGPAAVTSTTEIAPAIRLYGAQLLRVSAADRLVRLIVFASGDGKLQASFGNKILGNYTLRAGNNDIRFRLPADAIKSLRSISATRVPQSVLTLTSLSTTGTKGASLTRKVVISKPTRR